jgi:acid stress-induced BolA-like protein IbaG/YrbA
MQAQEIQQLLEQQLEGTTATVNVNGSHIDITIIGDIFEGVSRVKKQQLVYGAINEHIASGAIHAVDFIKAFTPDQWAAKA